MGKNKINWSSKANQKLYEILEYYSKRNKSKTFSIKIYKKLIKEISILNQQPEIGILTEIDDVRGLIVDHFIVFYEYNEKCIIIHTIWDSRQNPDDLKIK